MSGGFLEKIGRPWAFREDAPRILYAPPYPGLVINLDNRDGEGTHWTSAKYVPESSQLLYADPFGTKLGGVAPTELHAPGVKIVANRVCFQRLNTSLCGYYAILMAEAMEKVKEPLTQTRLEDLLWKALA